MRLNPLFVVWVSSLLLGSALHADDKEARERTVRVALALSADGPDACGKCREDVADARKDAVREKKVLVLFVGGPCDRLGCVAEQAGAIPVKSAEYVGDDRPKGEKRIVVLEPKADGSGLMIADTLPAASEPKAVTDAVKRATPAKAAPKKLTWEF